MQLPLCMNGDVLDVAMKRPRPRGQISAGRAALDYKRDGLGLVQSVNREARVMSDDVAAVVIQPTNAATAGLFRTEQLELTSTELESGVGERFLEACGLTHADIDSALDDARMISERFGGVILHVVFGNRLRVEVLPRNVESIEAASRRAAAAAR